MKKTVSLTRYATLWARHRSFKRFAHGRLDRLMPLLGELVNAVPPDGTEGRKMAIDSFRRQAAQVRTAADDLLMAHHLMHGLESQSDDLQRAAERIEAAASKLEALDMGDFQKRMKDVLDKHFT